MTGIEAWLFGYAGTKLLDKVLEFVRGDPFTNSLHKATEEWARKLPDGAVLGSTRALFPSHIPDELLDSRPALKELRDQFRSLEVPKQEQWIEALTEQWRHVRSTGPGLQEFFELDEEAALGHITELSKILDKVCVQNTAFFNVTAVSLLRQILEQIENNSPSKIEAADLDDDQLSILKRVADFDGKCGIWEIKGEYECLWMPGVLGNTQWGWERTPTEAELSGKPIGSRLNRMRWIFAARSLVEIGLMTPSKKDEKVFELTAEGNRIARNLIESGFKPKY